MPATRDGKTWRCQFYYEDWQGVRHKKNKRGFKTKAEAEEWERNFRQQQRKELDINFENFVEIYFADVENRLRESTIKNKRYVFDLKVTPYFKKKKMCEIKTADIRAWQNELIKQGYAPTYLKSINNQLAALFKYAVRYYDLKDNPCRKAGSIGKSKADDMEFWTKQEFKQFLPSMDKKPEAKMAFMLLYWTGMRIGELLALTYEDIDLEKRIISISKSYQRLDGKDVITPPKTPKSNRKITIPPFLAEELKGYCSCLYGIMPNERMFRFTKSYMEHEIVRGIKKAGVKRIRIHDLRHSQQRLQTDNKELEQRHEDLQYTNGELQNVNDRLSDDNHTLEQRNDAFQSDNQALRRQYNDLQQSNVQLEKQQKELKSNIGQMVQSEELLQRDVRKYDEAPEWQLPEPGAFTSAKAFRDKVVLPLVNKLKFLVKNLTIQCVRLKEEVLKLRKEKRELLESVEFYKGKIRDMNERTELLQEKADNLERVKRYAGVEQIDTIIGKVKEQERVELQARRYKRSYEAR